MERFSGGEHFLDKTLSILYSRPIFHLVGWRLYWIPIKKKTSKTVNLPPKTAIKNRKQLGKHGAYMAAMLPTLTIQLPDEHTICFLGNQT